MLKLYRIHNLIFEMPVGCLTCSWHTELHVDATLACTTSVTLVAVGVMWPKTDGTHW